MKYGAHAVSILAAAFIIRELLMYNGSKFSEKIPTAAGGFNNPGNIEKPRGRDTFRGEIVLEDGSRFTSFKSMAHGYRAIKKILKTKYKRGLVTLQQMISDYAPVEDGNNPENYASWVATSAGINKNTDMATYSDTLWQEVVKAIGVYEQGQDWVAANGGNMTAWVSDGFSMV